MHIRQVILSIILYGQPITLSFLARVKKNQLDNVFYPIGREVKYTIGDEPTGCMLKPRVGCISNDATSNVLHRETSIFYTPLSIIIWHSNHNIEIFEEPKFVVLLKHLLDRCHQLRIKTYQAKGIQILYVDQKPIINTDPRITTLENSRVPKQNRLRALIDITDQISDSNPHADINIVFYTTGTYQVDNLGKPKPFYIDSIMALMQFKYDGTHITIYSEDIGYFIYHTRSGNIYHILSDKLKQVLNYSFKHNYPDANEGIKINVLAIEINVNYRSIIFN